MVAVFVVFVVVVVVVGVVVVVVVAELAVVAVAHLITATNFVLVLEPSLALASIVHSRQRKTFGRQCCRCLSIPA